MSTTTTRRQTYKPGTTRTRVRWDRIVGGLATGLGIIALMWAAWTLGGTFGAPPITEPGSSASVPSWDAPVVVTSEDGQPVEVIEATPEPLPDGQDVVTPEPAAEPAAEPEPVVSEAPVPAPSPSEAPAWTMPAVPADWPFTTGETLVCGPDAKPAIDYREDVGYWAYCEPALVD